jgi:hypothetical protein
MGHIHRSDSDQEAHACIINQQHPYSSGQVCRGWASPMTWSSSSQMVWLLHANRDRRKAISFGSARSPVFAPAMYSLQCTMPLCKTVITPCISTGLCYKGPCSGDVEIQYKRSATDLYLVRTVICANVCLRSSECLSQWCSRASTHPGRPSCPGDSLHAHLAYASHGYHGFILVWYIGTLLSRS